MIANQLIELADQQHLAVPESLFNRYAVDDLTLCGSPRERAVSLAVATERSTRQLSEYSREMSSLFQEVLRANTRFELRGKRREQRIRITDERERLWDQSNRLQQPPTVCPFGSYDFLAVNTTEHAQIATSNWFQQETRRINSDFVASLQASRLAGLATFSPSGHASYYSAQFEVKDTLDTVERTHIQRTESGVTQHNICVQRTDLVNAYTHELTPVYCDNALIPARVHRLINALPTAIRPACSVLSGHRAAQFQATIELSSSHWQESRLTAAGRVSNFFDRMRSDPDPALIIGNAAGQSIVLTAWEPEELEREMRSPVKKATAFIESAIEWLERRRA